ncbi:MAG: ribosomal L7Ae/L30e/S12e/Gadd45 family protein [Tepidibacter sp.]|jgi:ribosomal protein L7Ae-like RNA K-turn-binding protein|uniref:L7Ae/L30e/S12e/Gadd45 family ribosomal protein n=1 Tax=Tepidibacter sp. TaxID=2529387 RepID=UPI0025D61A90|nr:ribosomal L7Ae/L30e/S12e/Gadd45 family protein [Tepidibacter sp.]MCT4507955.1 ribosomal L7Ae/L30e/S12e/Gadd45 family protein [Tepidibacter sp.]
MNNKILSLLGIVLKSGNLVSGDDTTLSDLKKGKIKLIIIANDASENTKKLFKDKSEYRDVPYIVAFTKEELGRSIGKSSRAVIGIKSEQFAMKIKEISRG